MIKITLKTLSFYTFVHKLDYFGLQRSQYVKWNINIHEYIKQNQIKQTGLLKYSMNLFDHWWSVDDNSSHNCFSKMKKQ